MEKMTKEVLGNEGARLVIDDVVQQDWGGGSVTYNGHKSSASVSGREDGRNVHTDVAYSRGKHNRGAASIEQRVDGEGVRHKAKFKAYGRLANASTIAEGVRYNASYNYRDRGMDVTVKRPGMSPHKFSEANRERAGELVASLATKRAVRGLGAQPKVKEEAA